MVETLGEVRPFYCSFYCAARYGGVRDDMTGVH